MTINLSLEMITVVTAILEKTPVPQLRAIQCDDGHGYEVDGTDALDLFKELRSETHLLFRGVRL